MWGVGGLAMGWRRGMGDDPIQYSNVGTRSTANTAPSTIVISFNANLAASAAPVDLSLTCNRPGGNRTELNVLRIH